MARHGIQIRRNPGNGLLVCRVHYTADARKRDPSWAASERKNYTERGWKREYDIDWTSPEGEPVVPEFQGSLHCQPSVPDPRLKLVRMWDFGYVSPVVLFAQLTEYDQLKFLRECCPFNTVLADLIPMARAITTQLLGPDAKCFDAGDPAAESHTDIGSAAEVCQQHHIFLHTNRPGTEVSYGEFRKRFSRMVRVPREGLQPAVVVDPAGCPLLVEALSGAFHLSPDPPYKPIKKHPYKDLVDAARYGHDNLSAITQEWLKDLSAMARADVRELRAG